MSIMMRVANRILNWLGRWLLRLKGGKIDKTSSIHHSISVTNPQNMSIGKQTTIYKMCSVIIGRTGSFIVADGSHIAPFGYLLIANNKIQIGNKVAIGPFCCMFCHSNHYKGAANFVDNYLDGDISIGSNVFIGAQVTLLPNTVIEDNVVIGANSVAKGRLESGWLYAGSPVRKIKRLR